MSQTEELMHLLEAKIQEYDLKIECLHTVSGYESLYHVDYLQHN